MNADELKTFLEQRQASPATRHFDVAQLFCYGCAHGASTEGFPGKPSGERPCFSCIRNPEREQWAKNIRDVAGREPQITVGDDGHARTFDPAVGTMYNGAPRLYSPMDNYVTLDSGDEERWLSDHPEYRKPVRFVGGDRLEVIDR